MDLDDLKVYQLSMEIGERVWSLVIPWDYFAKETVGKQVVRSADSIAANISEGFGRYSYKENKRFCYYSRGSLQETRTWLTKASSRGLIGKEDYEQLNSDLEVSAKMLNRYIQAIGQKSRQS